MRCEGINISGNDYGDELKYLAFLGRRMNTVLPEVPRLLASGGACKAGCPTTAASQAVAQNRCEVFGGFSPHCDKKKRMVLPVGPKVVRLKPARKFAYLRRLTHEVGWKYQAMTTTLEEEEKAKIHNQKKQLLRLRRQAGKNVEKITDKYTEAHGLLG
ncbi:hypothetical protein P7K49_019617 [Saguinus oedipus]|uniref:60S ribosomal protein L13a n=1 Tax=Saguinus oedipus TaxID=9490 RepID=A0ABQ9UYM2_SAGOE|nr:hypothetical protein P7K49_019617 [Saguinus oedipus]